MDEKHHRRTAQLETKQSPIKSRGGKEKVIPMAEPSGRRAQQKAVTQGLRTFFDAVVSEPIPDEFMELLKKMDERKQDGNE